MKLYVQISQWLLKLFNKIQKYNGTSEMNIKLIKQDTCLTPISENATIQIACDDLLEIAKETFVGGYYGEGYINNAMKMSSSFFKNWKNKEDARYLNTYNKFEETLKNIDFNSVYVDVGNHSGLITVCMSLEYGIQLDIISHIEFDNNDPVMFCIMLDGNLMVMNEIDLEDAPTMVEQIINSIKNKTMQ